MNFLRKGSKLYSILGFKCPRCHRGRVFKAKNPYNIKDMFKMHENCESCGLKYEVEPSFFYGAMYVSYAYSVAVFVATYIVMKMIYQPSVTEIVVALALVLLLCSPYVFRLARITWLNIFVKYDPSKKGSNLK